MYSKFPPDVPQILQREDLDSDTFYLKNILEELIVCCLSVQVRSVFTLTSHELRDCSYFGQFWGHHQCFTDISVTNSRSCRS